MLEFSTLAAWLLSRLSIGLAWFREPLHAGLQDHLNLFDVWHGVLMAFAGVILVPVGVMAARYWKIVPGQDWPRVLNHRGWQYVHLLSGGVACLCLVLGVMLAFLGMSLSHHLMHFHGWSGWGVMALLLLMVLNILLRGSVGGPGRHQARTLVHLHDIPGDHYDMTRRRRFFERVHRWLGYGWLVALMATVVGGYWYVNVPRGLMAVTVIWWAGLVLLAVRWERQGRAVDGYQARWGPSMAHPGNRIPLLGGGLRRYSEDEYRQLVWGGQAMRRRLRRTARRRRARRLAGRGRMTG
ncbi:MAG: hypothetical protein Q4B13_07145 [Lautropia sp.]|nr:hypothetical protein [Lautropia sp.]